MELNAAVTLSGSNASIDCKGYSISQISNALLDVPPASACKVGVVSVNDEPIAERKEMKQNCHLYYQAGILLRDGAKAINCKVQQFYDGIIVLNGGEVKTSEVSGNRHGIVLRDVTGSIETRVSDSFAHDNHIGVYVRNGASASAATIHEVTSKRNPGFGMIFHGPDITVKDSTASYNGIAGIWTGFGASSEFEYDGDYLTKLQFEGKVSSHHNILHGVLFSIMYILTPPGNLAEVNVLEEINTYLNGGFGLVISSIPLPTYIISFRVEEDGLVRSCQNSQTDILNHGFVNFFMDEGSEGYICDTSTAQFGQGLPTCAAWRSVGSPSPIIPPL